MKNISAIELAEWEAFYSLEPFGYEINMIGHAITSATIMNAQRTKTSDPSFSPEDFMPKLEDQEPQSTEEMIEVAAMLTAAYGGKDKRKKCQ